MVCNSTYLKKGSVTLLITLATTNQLQTVAPQILYRKIDGIY